MILTERQSQIVDAAIKLIAEQGIQNLTIKNLSGIVGISDAAIYRHFNSKDEIVMAMLNHFDTISGFVLSETETDDLSSLDKIKKFLFDRYKRFSENPKAARVMFSEEVFKNDERYTEKMLSIMHQHGESIRGIILEGQKNGEIRSDIPAKQLFILIFGSMRLLITQWNMRDASFDLSREGAELWDSICKMLK
ncbi:MAG: TetR/AcrR family transcriptional regulator [Candidatus Cloacimonetes bacterium]|nr:TetR/AcrR family transcriptional regulator [Candidatus Cloacimonadota bacterium]